MWYSTVLISIAILLVLRGIYRRSVPTAHQLLEQDFRCRTYPLERNRREFWLRGRAVSWSEILFVLVDYLALASRGELASYPLRYYKNGSLCSGDSFEKERERFFSAFYEGLKRRQGRVEYLAHLRKVAPFDYYEEVFCRKISSAQELVF